MHGPWRVVVPRIAESLEFAPLVAATAHAHILQGGVRFLEARYRGSEVGYPRRDVYYLVRPRLFVTGLRFTTHVHVDAPLIRVPRHLPVEVQTTEKFHADIEPETSGTDTAGTGIPATFFDQCPGSGNVVHALQGPFGHEIIDIQNHGGHGTDHGVTVWILQGLEQTFGCRIVVLQRLILRKSTIDQGEMPGTTSQNGVKKHGFVQCVER